MPMDTEPTKNAIHITVRSGIIALHRAPPERAKQPEGQKDNKLPHVGPLSVMASSSVSIAR